MAKVHQMARLIQRPLDRIPVGGQRLAGVGLREAELVGVEFLAPAAERRLAHPELDQRRVGRLAEEIEHPAHGRFLLVDQVLEPDLQILVRWKSRGDLTAQGHHLDPVFDRLLEAHLAAKAIGRREIVGGADRPKAALGHAAGDIAPVSNHVDEPRVGEKLAEPIAVERVAGGLLAPSLSPGPGGRLLEQSIDESSGELGAWALALLQSLLKSLHLPLQARGGDVVAEARLVLIQLACVQGPLEPAPAHQLEKSRQLRIGEIGVDQLDQPVSCDDELRLPAQREDRPMAAEESCENGRPRAACPPDEHRPKCPRGSQIHRHLHASFCRLAQDARHGGMNNDNVHQVYHGQKGDEATRILTRARQHWVVDHLPREGRMLDVGCSQGVTAVLLAQRGVEVIGLDNERPALDFAEEVRAGLEPEVRERIGFVEGDAARLPFKAREFDHAICSETLEHVDDPGTVIEEARRVLRPGGSLVVTVPFGILPHPDHKRVFYPEALAALLEPMFDIGAEVSVLDRHLAVVAIRRARAKGRPAFRLSPNEVSFLERERDLREELDRTRNTLRDANAKYREVTEAAGELREQAAKGRGVAADGDAGERTRNLEQELLEANRAPLAGRQSGAERNELLARLNETVDRQDAALGQIEARVPRVAGHLSVVERLGNDSGPGRPTRAIAGLGSPIVENDEFEQWRRAAAAAHGSDVVFMYSGTIHMQEKRGNRPIRLTRVYLEQGKPVFFNYWRWKTDDPPPEWGDPLLFQSPVDVTPTLLDRLLSADFGGKRKLMFASLPHELMIRALSRAAQNGWVTIYDARDDWEEFEKVGMAKWYDPGFEEFLVREADVVSAVSEPLARKLRAMGDREDIGVVANGLDPKFPQPRRRAPESPPVVGYFGHLTPKWFDWDLLVQAARAHPDWVFELAGHQHPEDVSLPENVRLLGLLGHSELAELSARWSFAVIPFKVSALAEAVDPIKAYEYLHLGLPVLSSYMPQMRDYPSTVIAESRHDFLALLPTMPTRGLDPAVVVPWLRANTWESRVESYDQLAADFLASSRAGSGLRGLLAR